MMILNIEDFVPENHLLKKIEKYIDLDYIYDLMKAYYSEHGRPAIDLVSLVKILLIVYLYGINSERKLI